MDVHCREREADLGWWWWCLAKPCWGSLLGSQQGAERSLPSCLEPVGKSVSETEGDVHQHHLQLAAIISSFQ